MAKASNKGNMPPGMAPKPAKGANKKASPKAPKVKKSTSKSNRGFGGY